MADHTKLFERAEEVLQRAVLSELLDLRDAVREIKKDYSPGSAVFDELSVLQRRLTHGIEEFNDRIAKRLINCMHHAINKAEKALAKNDIKSASDAWSRMESAVYKIEGARPKHYMQFALIRVTRKLTGQNYSYDQIAENARSVLEECARRIKKRKTKLEEQEVSDNQPFSEFVNIAPDG